jgi:hypothetical protein
MQRQPQLVTIPEAKRRTGVDRPLDRAIEARELDVYRVGAWRRLSWSQVLAWLDSKRAGASGPGASS